MKLYDRCKTPIRVVYFAFLLIAFGTMIQSDSVNIFYTFKNSFLLMFADGCLRLGQTIVINMPLIFMVNLVCKRANSGVPIILSLVGYFTFVLTMSIFSPQNLSAQAYMNSNGILPLAYGGHYPLETGLIGAFAVAIVVRAAFIHSRHRTSHSLLGFLKKDSAAMIYTIVLCSLTGIAMSYVLPFFYTYLSRVIVYISSDLNDPFRIASYGILDRFLSILGLGSAVRYPFWFTSAGGSYQTLGGQNILGDVNIWTYIKDVGTGFAGAGRFITPYYLLNMFVIPALLIGTVVSVSDKNERRKLIVPVFCASLVSFVCGNPLPYELTMLFVSPGLLAVYFGIVWFAFFVLSRFGIFLGSSLGSSYIASAMPGSFPDLIINIRNIFYFDSITSILIAGVAFFVLSLVVSIVYYRYISGGVRTGEVADDIISCVGGIENISSASSGLYRVDLYLNDLENISFESIRRLGSYRVIETRYGVSMEFGVASFSLARKIMAKLSSNTVPEKLTNENK